MHQADFRTGIRTAPGDACFARAARQYGGGARRNGLAPIHALLQNLPSLQRGFHARRLIAPPATHVVMLMHQGSAHNQLPPPISHIVLGHGIALATRSRDHAGRLAATASAQAATAWVGRCGSTCRLLAAHARPRAVVCLTRHAVEVSPPQPPRGNHGVSWWPAVRGRAIHGTRKLARSTRPIPGRSPLSTSQSTPYPARP